MTPVTAFSLPENIARAADVIGRDAITQVAAVPLVVIVIVTVTKAILPTTFRLPDADTVVNIPVPAVMVGVNAKEAGHPWGLA